MFLSQILANLMAILALSSNLVNVTPALAASDQDVANISQTEQITLVIPDNSTQTSQKEPNRVVKAVVTAYTSTPGQTDDSPFIAATGKRVHDGMIAVNGLPFGTVVKIPELFGDKEFVVEDRMNQRYHCSSAHCNMDIWMDTTVHQARVFGLRHVEAEIYLPASPELKPASLVLQHGGRGEPATELAAR